MLLLLLQSASALRLSLHAERTLKHLRKGDGIYFKAESKHHVTFVARVQINGLAYNMELDTGSTKAVIKGDKCGGRPKRKVESVPCRKQNYQQIRYSDGTVSGCYQRVSFLTEEEEQFQVEAFVLEQCSSQFEHTEGVLGLHPSPDHGFVDQLVKLGIVSQPVLAISLRTYSDQQNYLAIGDPDFSQVKQGQKWMVRLPLANQSKFKIEVASQFIDQLQSTPINSQTIMDTDNTNLCISNQMKKNYLRRLREEGLGRKCSFERESSQHKYEELVCKGLSRHQIQRLPSVKVVATGGLQIVFDQFDYLEHCQKEQHLYNCKTFLQANQDKNYIVLGQPFFQKYYAVIDFQEEAGSVLLGEYHSQRPRQQVFD